VKVSPRPIDFSPTERSVMRGLIKLALIVGAIAFAAKLLAAKKEEWTGLTEEQVRERLDARLPGKMPEEKRARVTERVVSRLRDRGALAEG
jgi:hypothetical protein